MPKNLNTIASHQFYIPPALLSALIHYAEQESIPYEHWFNETKLDISQIRQINGYVNFQQLCQVIQSAIFESRQATLGLKLGCSEGLISMGILGFAMQACKTVGEALQTGLNYHRISGSVLDLNFKIQHEICELEVSEHIVKPHLFEFFCDEVFASILTCCNHMVGEQNDLINVELSYKPVYFQEYEKLFNCPIIFNSKRNVMRFKSSFLNRKLKTYSPANYAAAIQICEKTQKEIIQINQASYAEILYSLIEQHLPERFDMKQAAEHFNMSERHLRRQLLENGHNFQHIRQNILEKKAKEMLQKNHSISEISQRLGFSELREFRRAFKRWTGAAPTTYKNTF